jgi:hypothetical protein
VLARAFHRVVLARRWLTFLVLCLSFALFGAGTLNLFNLFKANLALITDHGLMALADGAAQQLLELLATLALSLLAYVVFKACEYRLVQGLLHPPQKDPHP